jgi:hypothetical protein
MLPIGYPEPAAGDQAWRPPTDEGYMRRPSGRGNRAVPCLLASGVLATAALVAFQLGGAPAATVQAAFTALGGVAVVLIFAGSRSRSRERALWPVVGAAMTFNALCEVGAGWSRVADGGPWGPLSVAAGVLVRPARHRLARPAPA